jgi:YfiH family protein
MSDFLHSRSVLSSSPVSEPTVAANGVVWLSAPGLSGQRWLWHGFSTRRGGVSSVYSPVGSASELNLGFTAADSQENVRENRLRCAEAVTGSRETPLATVRQVHSNVSVIAVSGAGCEADGILTSEPGILLGIQTADCIPVLVADRIRKAVGAFHAGWRGTVARIVESGIQRMRAEFGSDPEDLIAAIGPGIGACCYSVGQEVLGEFESNFRYASELFSRSRTATGEGLLHLDLIEANRRQLLDGGLKAGAISVAGGCTGCHPELFYSHRTARGHAGRMMSVIGIRPA